MSSAPWGPAPGRLGSENQGLGLFLGRARSPRRFPVLTVCPPLLAVSPRSWPQAEREQATQLSRARYLVPGICPTQRPSQTQSRKHQPRDFFLPKSQVTVTLPTP